MSAITGKFLLEGDKGPQAPTLCTGRYCLTCFPQGALFLSKETLGDQEATLSPEQFPSGSGGGAPSLQMAGDWPQVSACGPSSPGCAHLPVTAVKTAAR